MKLEKKLVASSRDGDASAYGNLVRACSSRVMAICLGVLANSHDAEDAAQQALIRGYTEIDQLRNGQSFSAWIGRIAKNQCIDFVRRRNREKTAYSKLPEKVDNQLREYPELEEALGKLNEDSRLVLLLYYFNGRSTQAIADTLEISPDAVHTRMSRARKQLRKILDTEVVR